MKTRYGVNCCLELIVAALAVVLLATVAALAWRRRTA